MQWIPIDDLDDPRILPYRDLPRSRMPQQAGLLIAEGRLLVERLLASDFRVHSLLVDTEHRAWVAERLRHDVPVYVGSKSLIEQIIGFNFHRGVLACAYRRPLRHVSDVVPLEGPCTLVVCHAVQDPENLGGMLRNAAAFGADAVIVGPHSADAFSRRVLRVSMGAAFRLQIAELVDWQQLRQLRDRLRVELVAAVLDERAQPLREAGRGERLALVFGNEAHGLDDDTLALCDRRVTIPMHPGTDSLNVAVASGIFLYHFVQVAGWTAAPSAAHESVQAAKNGQR